MAWGKKAAAEREEAEYLRQAAAEFKCDEEKRMARDQGIREGQHRMLKTFEALALKYQTAIPRHVLLGLVEDWKSTVNR